MRFLLILLLLLPALARAQAAATLIADQIVVSGDNRLIASGNIEAFFDGTTLRASQLIYDRSADRLEISGPLVIRAADGTVLTASTATLDPQLRNGILLGARIVLDQQLQIAANQIDRRDGRYLQLYKTAASSCRICGTRPPLWEIRAERVVHDQLERQLYFENATFRIRGVPLFWLPRMRLPDPTLERATGFLIPQQRTTSQLGTGIKIPYFIRIGDDKDLTLTPYLSRETRTLELIYRQAFRNGSLTVNAAASEDTLEAPRRSYAVVEGDFTIAEDYRLRFDIEAVSDTAYLADYDYSGKDRLDSAIDITRVTDRSLLQSNFTYYQTLRDDEVNASLPPIVASLSYEERVPLRDGSTLSYGAGIDTAYRYGDRNGDAGRDVTRLGAHVMWRRDLLLPAGILAEAQAGLRSDAYRVVDDARFAPTLMRTVPQAGLTLRWPWQMMTAAGTGHVIEPVLQLAWSAQTGDTPPNEDSTRSELDKGNLISMSRFTGEDAVETGARGAAGITWTRSDAAGTTTALTFGRVLRADAQDDFTPSSGLAGQRSDWLVGGHVQAANGLGFDARALFDDAADVRLAAALVAWRNDRLALSAAYIWQDDDPLENRDASLSEWTFDSDITLSDAWSLRLDGRYDVGRDAPVRAGIGLQWRNECVTIDVSASRRYTSSDNVAATTTFGLSAALSGFSAGRAGGGPAAPCRR